MGDDSQATISPIAEVPAKLPADCPLAHGQQTRNVLLYGANVALVYLAAPVLYVGLVGAALCKRLDASDTVSNLPTTAYFWATILAILVAWYFPFVRVLKPVLIGAYLSTATAAAVVAASLVLQENRLVVIAALLGYAVVLGITLQTISTFQWEVLARGVSARRRGQALALAFGGGPVLAVVGSLISQLILSGRVDLPLNVGALTLESFGVGSQALGFPWNFAVLFAACVPLMLFAAVLSMLFVVPRPDVELTRKPFVSGIFGGFREFWSSRVIKFAVLATILVFAGNMIISNLGIYTEEATGQKPEQLAGYQNSLRFGFKIIAGLLLGWLLARTNPKAATLATGLIGIAGVCWALLVPGKWFLIAFGLLGAGELYGIYYPNYILSCSRPEHVRRNMAFAAMLPMPASIAPVLFGWLSDNFGHHYSMLAALLILLASVTLVLVGLPAKPRPE